MIFYHFDLIYRNYSILYILIYHYISIIVSTFKFRIIQFSKNIVCIKIIRSCNYNYIMGKISLSVLASTNKSFCDSRSLGKTTCHISFLILTIYLNPTILILGLLSYIYSFFNFHYRH